MLRDVLWAVRRLGQNRVFTLAVTAILALGIGADTAVFSMVDAVLLRPLPYASPERLVRIDEFGQRGAQGISGKDYLEWSARTGLFDRTGAYVRDFVTLTGADEPDQVMACRTTPGLFGVLGVPARIGRGLLESDGAEAPQCSVIICGDGSSMPMPRWLAARWRFPGSRSPSWA